MTEREAWQEFMDSEKGQAFMLGHGRETQRAIAFQDGFFAGRREAMAEACTVNQELRESLLHSVRRNHEHSNGCDGCLKIMELLTFKE